METQLLELGCPRSALPTPHSLGKLIEWKSPDSLGGSPGFSVYSCLHHTLLSNFCFKTEAVSVSSPRLGKLSIPAYPFIEMVASLFAIDLPGNQSGAIGLPNKLIAPGFSVVSKEKSKSGRPKKTFGNMRFYEIAHRLLAA